MVLSLIALGFLLATVLVGVFFASIHSLKRQLYLLFWAGAWLLFALHLLPTAISHWTAPNPFLLAMSSCLFGFAGIGFFLGTQLYMRQKVRRGLAITAAMVLIAWASANALQVLSISAVLPASLIYIAVAVLFWRESRHHETLADQLLAIAFAVWDC